LYAEVVVVVVASCYCFPIFLYCLNLERVEPWWLGLAEWLQPHFPALKNLQSNLDSHRHTVKIAKIGAECEACVAELKTGSKDCGSNLGLDEKNLSSPVLRH
jgi:hypothetical protein